MLPRDHSSVARAALDVVEDVVAFGACPVWVVRPEPRARIRRCDRSSASLRRVSRGLAGRSVGLALSSGGSKTLAHLGVMRVLRAMGVPTDGVAGTSGGALVAAGWAFGFGVDRMIEMARELARNITIRRFGLNLLPRSGLFSGARHELFDTWFEGRTVADASVPLWVVATDVRTGDEVIIDSGPVADGLRASMGVPLALDPWRRGDRLLVDGALVNPMPATVLRGVGTRFVVGSDVAGQELIIGDSAGHQRPHLFQILTQMINSMEREAIRPQEPLVDVMIRPRVRGRGTLDCVAPIRSSPIERAAREQAAAIALLGRCAVADRSRPLVIPRGTRAPGRPAAEHTE